MKITITTYVDDEKLNVSSYDGKYKEEQNFYVVEYFDDKNKKNFKIIIDKNKDNVSIIKDNVTMNIKNSRNYTNYATEYGIFNLETELFNVVKLEKNNFICFEINYKLYFSNKDSQNMKLKILIKKVKEKL